jgi:hypothetical protein
MSELRKKKKKKLDGFNYLNSTKNYDKHRIQLQTLSNLVRVRESSNSLISFSLNYRSFFNIQTIS